jgi:hypothetical protein
LAGKFERGKLCREILIGIVNVISEMTMTAAAVGSAAATVAVAAVAVAAERAVDFVAAKCAASVWIKLTS